MTMHEIEKLVTEYNSNRTTMTAADAAKLFASIDAACKTMSDENHKSALDRLIEKPAQSAIILAMVEGTAVYIRVGTKTDSKTGELSIRTTTPELEWITVATNYAESMVRRLQRRNLRDGVEGVLWQAVREPRCPSVRGR